MIDQRVSHPYVQQIPFLPELSHYMRSSASKEGVSFIIASVSGAAETTTMLQLWKQLKQLVYGTVKPVRLQEMHSNNRVAR